ncbi:MAG: DUF368 domain-containing protein [Myxococcales bacterium]|jgi:putative membrane protein|nr:DUF368 domain-containing protein [Myxococcales bacterium]
MSESETNAANENEANGTGLAVTNATEPSPESVPPSSSATGIRRWRSDFITFLKGLWVGATMTVPGVSGGSMAIIVGCYDQLISSVSQIFQKPKASLRFLTVFMIGSGLGIFTIAKVMSDVLLAHFPMPTRFFFMGAVAGGIPLVFREAKISKLDFKPKGVLRFLVLIGLGLLTVWGIAQLPKGLFAPGDLGPLAILIQLVGGVVVAAALVLPGISTSQMLLMLGLYEDLVARVKSFDVLPLIPLGVGVLVGTFLITKALERLIERYPQATYMIILGFVLGSIPELFPGLPGGIELPVSIVAALAGFAIIYFLSNLKKPQEAGGAQQ